MVGRVVRGLLTTTTVLAVLASTSAVRAGDPAVAREQLKLGYTLAQEGKCGEAIPHLLESLRLDPKAITLLNLADCEERVGKLADALGHWVDARVRAQTEGAEAIGSEAERRAKELEPRLARLTIVLARGAPSDAKVTRDGLELGAPSLSLPLPIEPGTHKIVVRAAGRVDRTVDVTLTEGESKRVEVEVGPVDPTPRAEAPTSPPPNTTADAAPSSLHPLVFVGFGVGAVGLGVGAVTGVMALGAGSDAKTACPNGVCRDQKALDDATSGQTLGTVSTIGFVVGAAGAAVGIYGLTLKPKKADGRVGVALGPSFVGLRGQF